MSTVLLASLGSPGDINPFVAVAMALREDGFTPLFLANPYDIPSIEKHGIETVPVGEPWDLMSTIARDPKYLLSPQAGVHTTKDIFIPYSANLYPAAVKVIEERTPAAVISHPFCYGSTWAARTAKVPAVVAHLAPISLLSKEVFAAYPAPRRLLFSLVMPLGRAQFDRLVKPLCASIGVPWSWGIIERTMCEPDLLLGMWSRRFVDLPSFTARDDRVICGFPFLKGEANSLDQSLEEYLQNGSPPVVITLGTNAYVFAGSFFNDALQTCSALGHRVVVITKGQMSVELPNDAFSVAYADYRILFPRCIAVVHHGGAGVTAQALRAGVQSIIVPFGHDQEDNGMRAKMMGLGDVVPRGKTKARLRSVLREVLGDEARSRAATIGQELRAEKNGAAVAAGEVVRWMARRGSG